MKESFVLRFDEKDIEVVETLKSLGVPRKVSNMLAYLTNVEEATSREIERGSDLRQPEGKHRTAYSAQEQLDRRKDKPKRWDRQAHEGL